MFARMRGSAGWAWFGLCCALAVHVADEASTGFLAVYNPTVLAIRARLPWLPLPVFDFRTWLAGLIAAVLALITLSWFVFRGARWTAPAAYVFAIIMIANSLGHTTGTVLQSKPMPGFYSSPLLLAAAIWLAYRTRHRHAES